MSILFLIKVKESRAHHVVIELHVLALCSKGKVLCKRVYEINCQKVLDYNCKFKTIQL